MIVVTLLATLGSILRRSVRLAETSGSVFTTVVMSRAVSCTTSETSPTAVLNPSTSILIVCNNLLYISQRHLGRSILGNLRVDLLDTEG
jgi:hypothetical protein